MNIRNPVSEKIVAPSRLLAYTVSVDGLCLRRVPSRLVRVRILVSNKL